VIASVRLTPGPFDEDLGASDARADERRREIEAAQGPSGDFRTTLLARAAVRQGTGG